MKELGIYCQEVKYSQKLAEYLSEKIEYEFQIVLYFSREELLKAVKDNKADTLIIDEGLYEEVKEILSGKSIKIICLTELRNTKKEGCTVFYKYMPVSLLVPDIVTFNKDKGCKNENEKHSVITCIYSPIGGIGTTSFSIAYCREKGRNKKVLYLSLEAFSAVSEILFLNEEKTVSEALYWYITKSEEEYDRNNFVQKSENFYVMAPARSYIEISTVKIENWRNFIIFLQSKNEYEEIVIELSECIDEFMELFKISDQNLILQRDGLINVKKIELFKTELKRELTEKKHNECVQYIDMPQFEISENEIENIEATEIGKWVREEFCEL